MVWIGSLCLISISIIPFLFASNFTIFYTNRGASGHFVKISVSSVQQHTGELLIFYIFRQPGIPPIVYLNNTLCGSQCSAILDYTEIVTLTFAHDNYNIVTFQQLAESVTSVYYRSCYENMGSGVCRYWDHASTEICICTSSAQQCTYNDLLIVDEPWCKDYSNETTTQSSLSTATTTKGSSRVVEFTLMYRKSDSKLPVGFNTLNVNITTIMKGDYKMDAFFDVYQSDDFEHTLLVNGMPCMRSCSATASVGYSISVDTDDDLSMLYFLPSNQQTLVVVYDSCYQPMDSVKCRERSESNTSLCLCNGLGQGWDTQSPFLLQENFCMPPTTTTTEMTTERTTTIRTLPNTTTTALSTTSTTSLTPSSVTSPASTSSSPITLKTTFITKRTTTSPVSTATTPSTTLSSTVSTTTTVLSTSTFSSASSSSSTTLLSTATTSPSRSPTTTAVNNTLKYLSDSGVGPNNVSMILNETLTYSEMGDELTSTQIQEITNILSNSAAIENLKPEDSQNILRNMDGVLSADEEQIQESGNSSQRLLSLLPQMVQNTNSSQFDFLTGMNLGFTAKRVDCSSTTDDALVDFGNFFEILNGSLPKNIQNNAVYIPIGDICKQQPASHVYLTVYRNRKLFIGPTQYQTYRSTTRWAERTADTDGAVEKLAYQGTGKQHPAKDEPALPSPCSRQTALPENAPVMSGTLMYNDAIVSHLAADTTMAVLKFNVTKVLPPLHGHFQVTWWDTEKLVWSTEQRCTTTKDGDIITANCPHLTDFTLIVDAALNDPNVCESALMNLGYTVNAISICSLAFLMFMNLSSYWPMCVRNGALMYLRGYASPSRDFVSLIHKVTLLAFYAVFTIFSDKSVSGRACELFGALSYSALMSSVLLTIAQALRLSPVLGSLHSWVKIVVSPSISVTISVLLPLSISILLLVITSFFDRGDCFCWVRPDYVIYAVIIPISLMLLNGILCTIIVCYRVFGIRRKLSKSVRHKEKDLMSKVVAVILMQISLGMPWVLQYPTLYSPYTTVWHYVFTIVMGSQGTVLVLLFFYKRTRSMSTYRESQQSQQSILRENHSATQADND
ncbi:hypothetical protein Q1695_012299 [Nippostrongylus brasiliensis]|nr:hypothetical protein Q1695_012299 [Nippostrongylus brasiliensis]